MPLHQFIPLPDRAVIFRLAEIGSTFLPEDANLPNTGWFQPSTEDKRQAEERGRAHGVSVWNRELVTIGQAKAIFRPGSKPDGLRAFGLRVQQIRQIGQNHAHELDAVTDPLPPERGPGAEGHCALEGLKRRQGQSRPDFMAVLDSLVEACSEMT